MKAYYFIFFISLAGCHSQELFKGSQEVYSPVMISPALLAYTKCVNIGDYANIQPDIDRARDEEGDFKVIKESKEMIVVGYSENAAKYYFNSKASCQAYTDSLKAMGWHQK